MPIEDKGVIGYGEPVVDDECYTEEEKEDEWKEFVTVSKIWMRIK